MFNYLGEIKPFTGNFAPEGWMLCDGQLLPTKEYDALFALIGNTYGGNGVDSFALPDLRGRVSVGQGGSFPIGTKAGTEQATLTEANLPMHTHTVYASSATNNDNGGAANGFWGSTATDISYAVANNAAKSGAMNIESTTATGSGEPHENRIPILAVTYIIAITGIYPARG